MAEWLRWTSTQTLANTGFDVKLTGYRYTNLFAPGKICIAIKWSAEYAISLYLVNKFAAMSHKVPIRQ